LSGRNEERHFVGLTAGRPTVVRVWMSKWRRTRWFVSFPCITSFPRRGRSRSC